MPRSSLCDYSDWYILAKGTKTVANTTVASVAANNASKKMIFENYASFTKWISKINNTQIDDTLDIDVVMPMFNLIEYSNNYSKPTGILWQYCRDELALDDGDAITDFKHLMLLLIRLKSNKKITCKTSNNGTKIVEIMIPLKNLSNFWRTLEISLIYYEIILDLNWSKKCVIMTSNADQETIFLITETKTLCFSYNFN